MKNKTSMQKRTLEIIRTAHVFFDEDQVFIKSDMQEVSPDEVAEWFPTDFKWIPTRT